MSADVSLCLVSVSLHTFLHNQNNLKCLGYASWEGLSSKFKGFSKNVSLMKSSETLSRDINRSHILLHHHTSRLQNSIALTDMQGKSQRTSLQDYPKTHGNGGILLHTCKFWKLLQSTEDILGCSKLKEPLLPCSRCILLPVPWRPPYMHVAKAEPLKEVSGHCFQEERNGCRQTLGTAKGQLCELSPNIQRELLEGEQA